MTLSTDQRLLISIRSFDEDTRDSRIAVQERVSYNHYRSLFMGGARRQISMPEKAWPH